MGRTRKVGVAGTFGSRYGKTLRDRYARVHAVRTAAHRCPACAKPALVREAAGIWRCATCRLKLAGKAYSPATP